MAALTNLMGPDLPGRFGAWWNGRDYVAPPAAEEGAADAAAAPEKSAAEKPAGKPALKVVDKADDASHDEKMAAPVSTAEIRVKALSALWGEGRFMPGSAAIDQRLLDEVFAGADGKGDVGFIGCDTALINACRNRTERVLHIAEWRTGCLDILKAAMPGVDAFACDIDRPRGFADHALEALVSVDAFAFADHKAGLIARAHKALTEDGRWVFLETTRTTAKAPAEAFASAWAEPMITTAEDIEAQLRVAGFLSVKRVTLTTAMLETAKNSYAGLSGNLGADLAKSLSGGQAPRVLQELAWEAQSWRARCRALEGGALQIDMWICSKQADPNAEPPGPPALDRDALFE